MSSQSSIGLESATLLDQVNESGFPLQITAADLVNRTQTDRKGKVKYQEHAWNDPNDTAAGFIDLAHTLAGDRVQAHVALVLDFPNARFQRHGSKTCEGLDDVFRRHHPYGKVCNNARRSLQEAIVYTEHRF